ncbi:spore germination protein [Siminovitchia terrae]|uniref:spore germination protein n=1 Tax=Siminovitchia terrae TaxID=1914933 RepID=UPI001B076977|nr:spore germination protein [Siminovitchia terrae]GIN92621.1 spore germination protein [Siminovitchia terrae]
MRFFKKGKAKFVIHKEQDFHTDDSSISPSLEEVKTAFDDHFGHQNDVIYRNFIIQNMDDRKAMLVFMKDITNQDWISQQIIKPLSEVEYKQEYPGKGVMTSIKERVLTTGDIVVVDNLVKAFDELLSGKAILFLGDETSALAISVSDWESRSVEEPTSQTVVRGPREGFTESLSKNKALLRKRIQSHQFRIETSRVGEITQTNVSIAFIEGIAEESIINEVKKRINDIHIDGVLESNNIEELIQDQAFTPFPTVANSERPDVVAAALLEGRVAILVDGTPFALMVPVVFMQFFQTPEDYSSRAVEASFLRIMRHASLLITLLVPSIYIALTTFHQEMIPPKLLTGLAAQREGVPFPAFVEALFMELTFEILREAGIRMPKSVGQAVSVVGAIVIGQAAVEADFVSAAMVIVVSITAIASFVMPSYNLGNSVRMLRFFIMICAASFGFFGIMLGLFSIIVHLCSLRSFGVPYMAPMAPFNLKDQKDTFVRMPRTTFSSKGEILRKQTRQ